MSQSQETVTVETDSRAIGKGFAQFAGDFKAAIKSGNTFEEAIEIASAALKDIAPVLSRFEHVPADLAEDPGAELVTAALTGRDLLNAIKG